MTRDGVPKVKMGYRWKKRKHPCSSGTYGQSLTTVYVSVGRSQRGFSVLV